MKRMTNSKFKQIKQFQTLGWSIEGTRRRCGVSWETARRVFEADSPATYGPAGKHRIKADPIPQAEANHINPAISQITRLRDDAQKRVDAYNLVLENIK